MRLCIGSVLASLGARLRKKEPSDPIDDTPFVTVLLGAAMRDKSQSRLNELFNEFYDERTVSTPRAGRKRSSAERVKEAQ